MEFRVEYKEIVDLVSKKIPEIQKDGQVKHLIAIMRWGVFPAVLLHERILPSPTISTVVVSHYAGQTSSNDFVVDGFNGQNFGLWREFKENEILVVDDLVDGGKTFETFSKLYRGPKYRSFVIFKKPYENTYEPTYVCKHLPTTDWVHFPWDS